MMQLATKIKEGVTTYATPRYVRIHDLRLGILYTVVRILIILWTVVDLLGNHRYAAFEVPTGTVNTWVPLRDPPKTNETTLKTLRHCTHSNEFNYDPDAATLESNGGWAFYNFSCNPNIPSEDIVLSGVDMLGITTAMSILPPGCNQLGCRTNYLVSEPENFLLLMLTSAQTSWTQWANLPLQMYDVDGKLVKDTGTQGWASFRLKELLEWCKIDLNDHSYHPAPRVSGITISITVEYTNLQPWNWWDTTMRTRLHFRPLFGTWGYRGPSTVWHHDYNQVVRADKMHVRLEFKTSGAVGRFSFFNMLLSIISGVVLLRIARVCVDFIASNMLGQAVVFNEAKYEDVEDLREVLERKMTSMVDVQNKHFGGKSSGVLSRDTTTPTPDDPSTATSTSIISPTARNPDTNTTNAAPINTPTEAFE